jgi:uncharacterized membrane protein
MVKPNQGQQQQGQNGQGQQQQDQGQYGQGQQQQEQGQNGQGQQQQQGQNGQGRQAAQTDTENSSSPGVETVSFAAADTAKSVSLSSSSSSSSSTGTAHVLIVVIACAAAVAGIVGVAFYARKRRRTLAKRACSPTNEYGMHAIETPPWPKME